MHKLAGCAALLLSAAPAFAQIPESVEPAVIPNYRLLKPGLATAGQPTPEALRMLKQQGFKTVINLRAQSEPGVAEEEAIVKAQGLEYVSVPVTPASFSQRQVDQVAKVLDDKEAGPILFHCGSANRVGAVWTVIQAQRGQSYEAAEAEGRKIGLSSPAMLEAVKKVLGREEK
jgi:uncharacterized protein (TIGR01244 family)